MTMQIHQVNVFRTRSEKVLEASMFASIGQRKDRATILRDDYDFQCQAKVYHWLPSSGWTFVTDFPIEELNVYDSKSFQMKMGSDEDREKSWKKRVFAAEADMQDMIDGAEYFLMFEGSESS